MARLSAHGTEVIRIWRVSPTGLSSLTLSFRSDGTVLQRVKNGSYNSGWKLRPRTGEAKTHEKIIANLKEKGWKELKGRG